MLDLPYIVLEVFCFGLLVWRPTFLDIILVRISLLCFGKVIFFFVVYIISFSLYFYGLTASFHVIFH